MTTPIKESISADLLTTVNGVTVANEYNQTIIVKRARHRDYGDTVPDDLTGVLEQDSWEEDAEAPHNTRQIIQNYLLTIFIIDSEDTTSTWETRYNNVEADVWKAIMTDITRGGYAIDTEIISSEKLEEENIGTGITMTIAVKFRHKDDDPYTGL